jgi:hypothetical protein
MSNKKNDLSMLFNHDFLQIHRIRLKPTVSPKLIRITIIYKVRPKIEIISKFKKAEPSILAVSAEKTQKATWLSC